MENIVRYLEKRKAEQIAVGMSFFLATTNKWIEVFTKEIAARKKSGLWFGMKRRP